MPPITVRDVIRLALPAGTTLAAGAIGQTHQVTWVITPRATPPLFAQLRGGELAIVALDQLRLLDDTLTLATLVERLAPVPIAAICVQGTIDEAARQMADDLRLPLLRLPDTVDLREVEREVQRLISDYEAQIERRAAQLAAVLTQRSLAGDGPAGLIDVLADRTGRGAACYSSGGEVRAMRARGSARVALQTLPVGQVGLVHHLGQTLWVQVLGAGGDRLGYLALCGDAVDDWDRLATQQGAAALALELAKEHAVLAAEERLRGDFVQAVLAGLPTDIEALHQRGRELGYDLTRPHTALLCATGDTALTPERALAAVSAALGALGITAPLMRRADGVLCYIATDDRGRSVLDQAEALRARLRPEMTGVAVALGREAANTGAWQRSLREAEQALRIGRQLLDSSRVLAFGDLGVYRLLILLRESQELWEFYRLTLAALAEYDREQGAELLKTLDVFFDNLGNLARTAEALHVHRNTLLYRIGRIREISGLDPDQADERLAMWIALKAHRVLQTLDIPAANE